MKRYVTILTLLSSFCVFAAVSHASVTATGRRTIHQSLEGHTATDLHFTTYQADRNTAWIEDWEITVSEPFTGSSMVPDDWPFNDSRTHSVTVDLTGMSVPYCTDVDLTVDFTLNEYNSVKFTDMYWTYDDHDPVEILTAAVGWGFNTTPGSSAGGWVISKYTIRDMAGNIRAVDMVGHENATTDNPSLMDMFISNGLPEDPGTESIKITDWGVVELDYLPDWSTINTWTNWDYFVPEVIIAPGTQTTIPEPTTFALLAIGGLSSIIRKRR